jgi:hypothetical protein
MSCASLLFVLAASAAIPSPVQIDPAPPAPKQDAPAKPADPQAPPKQDAPPQGSPQQAPPQGTPPQGQQGQPAPGQPAIRPGIQRPPAASRPPVANRPVEDAEKYRDGQTAAVTRAAEIVELDLSGVNLERDPLLLLEGQPITRADLDRELCLMLGANEIDQFITGVLLRKVKKEMADAGQPVPQNVITEEDVAKKFEEDKKVMPQMRGMTPEEFERQIKEVFGWQHYVEFQKQQMEFERFFLPDPPEEWAKKQQAEAKRLDDEQAARLAAKEKEEAAQNAGNGKPTPPKKKEPQEEPPTPEADLSFVPARTWELLDPRFVDTLKKNYARGNSLHPLFRGGIVSSLRKKLLESVEVRVAAPGEGDAVMFCAGESFKIKDLLALLAGRIDDHSRRLALRELVNLRAADARLTKDGALLSEADAEVAFADFQKKFAGTLIPAEYAVTAFGFNSLWHYRAYFRRKQSYQSMIEKKVTEEQLATHYDKAGRLFFENGTCIAQVLFVPGEDRAQSKQEIDALLAEVAGGKAFAAIAREKGKYPDGGDVHGGAMAPLIRGKLRTALGETEYTSFLSGYSFADEAFYAGKEDVTLGPVWRDLSPKLTGWIALHVDRFFTTGNKAPISDPKMRERALDDYADVTFPRYVNEALASCRIDLPTG